MTCTEIRDLMPDLAAGQSAVTSEVNQHLRTCPACAGKLAEMRQTMAMLDEWRAPEPSPYFDVRLRARLREQETQPAGWWQWLRKPALAAALTVLLAVGVGLFYNQGGIYRAPEDVAQAEPGTAVGDLQALDKNHELYTDFELLDDLEVQHDVVQNP